MREFLRARGVDPDGVAHFGVDVARVVVTIVPFPVPEPVPAEPAPESVPTVSAEPAVPDTSAETSADPSFFHDGTVSA